MTRLLLGALLVAMLGLTGLVAYNHSECPLHNAPQATAADSDVSPGCQQESPCPFLPTDVEPVSAEKKAGCCAGEAAAKKTACCLDGAEKADAKAEAAKKE
jgi:hypothetical protein